MSNEFDMFGIENLEKCELSVGHFNHKKSSRWLTSQKLIF